MCTLMPPGAHAKLPGAFSSPPLQLNPTLGFSDEYPTSQCSMSSNNTNPETAIQLWVSNYEVCPIAREGGSIKGSVGLWDFKYFLQVLNLCCLYFHSAERTSGWRNAPVIFELCIRHFLWVYCWCVSGYFVCCIFFVFNLCLLSERNPSQSPLHSKDV